MSEFNRAASSKKFLLCCIRLPVLTAWRGAKRGNCSKPHARQLYLVKAFKTLSLFLPVCLIAVGLLIELNESLLSLRPSCFLFVMHLSVGGLEDRHHHCVSHYQAKLYFTSALWTSCPEAIVAGFMAFWNLEKHNHTADSFSITCHMG